VNSIHYSLINSIQILKKSGSSTPRLDAELLLAHVLDCTRTHLITWPERPVNNLQLTLFNQLIARRSKGEPIAYILGKKEFWGLELDVAPSVLIPRPETELLVELALEKLDIEKEYLILDLGTGSGAIALAIARERPMAKVVAVDKSEQALNIAKLNKNKLSIQNLELVQSNWLDFFKQTENNNYYKNKFDLIVSNPPYIRANDLHLLQKNLSFEPQIALIAKDQGFADLFYIIDNAMDFLKPYSWLMLEHGFDQHVEIQKRLITKDYKKVKSCCDLLGIYRVTLAQKK
jgi:release factor glutamine methyltransferase